MITDEKRNLILEQYYDRGIMKKEIRSYEVSLWTLQDSFITVLKWSDVEQKGRIENPKMTLNIDGTEKFTFSIPMYYRRNGKLVDNPNWYNVKEGNLIEGMRKVKVIFNKATDDETVFEFLITHLNEDHEQDILTCSVECEGLAFQELGKIGYKINLSQDNFELQYKDWIETGHWTKKDGTTSSAMPLQTVDYWCEESGLVKLPANTANISSRTWYYTVRMSWGSFEGATERVSDQVYEEAYTTSWTADLSPASTHAYQVKARAVSAENSNLYNITQTIAEQFGIFCRYEYLYNENYQIRGKVIVFYNNFFGESSSPLTLQYPYSASKTSRTTECMDITTKLYVLDVDNESTLEGYNTIMNAPPNASREDYILNFDYLYKNGSITQEQYDAIKPYEIKMREYNDVLIKLQQQLNTYQTQLNDWSAKKAIAEKSIDLDQETILQNTKSLNSYDILTDDDQDGYMERTGANADYLLLITDANGRRYVNLKNTNKGIKTDSVGVYLTLSSGTLSNPVTGFEFKYDSNNNPTEIYFTTTIADTYKAVYLTYKYDPNLYYENVINTWEIKLNSDTVQLNKYTQKIGPTSATEAGYDLSGYPYGTTMQQAYEMGINKKINDCQDGIGTALLNKNKAITAFERLMGPAIREGYWQPEDYSDHGDEKEYSGTFSTSDITVDVEDGAISAWDTTLFEDEDTLYYQTGINQMYEFYPCIDLSNVYGTIPSDLNNYSLVWKATNKQNYSYDWNSIKDLRILAVDSQALIKFIKIGNAIKPVLMIIGAKNFTGDELERMILTGGARLEKYHDGTHSNITNISSNSWICYKMMISKPSDWSNNLWNKYASVSSKDQYPLCYPRIKFSSLALKTDAVNLILKYNNTVLSLGYDYYGGIRDTIRENTYFTEYYVTVKPGTIIKYGLNKQIEVHYVISNANTAIYLDAKHIANENAYPKVSYEVNTNLLNTGLAHTLYKQLARVVMINDAQLKFENVFGYISGMDLDLDNVSNDTIEVKNYKNKFEDLFSTIVAQTEEMKRSSSMIADALTGGLGLSSQGLEHTLSQNELVIQAYLDSHFDSSQVVKDKLESLFTEAGEILADSKNSLNSIRALTSENSSILAGFIQNVADLSVTVYRQSTKPTSFKSGDVWIDDEGNHYVATSSSSEGGLTGTTGFVRTRDGTLASITGAALNINADDGIIDIEAENEINIKSGNSVYIAANDKVDIVGNREVNIGGTTINIASESANGTVGGINIVAAQYDTANIANSSVAKVLIHPEKITMAGSIIEMYTGTASTTSAIKIDGTVNTNTPGIWIGSSKSVELYSGTGTSTGSSVSINPTHIIMGVVSGANASAFELKPSYLIMTVGTTNSDFSSSNVTINANSSITGMKLTKDSFGLATNSNGTRSVILANNNGITLGTGSTPITSGSYVTISGEGVDIGSLGKLYVNMNNFKLQTDTTHGTRFAVGTNLNNVNIATLNSTDNFVGLVYNKNGLFINGVIYATSGSFTGAVHASSFELTGTQATSDFNSAVGSTASLQGVSSAAATAQSTADGIRTDVSPIVTYGMTSGTWNGRNYGLILGNNKTDPMLIGSNGGIHIVNAQKTSTAVIIDASGIDIASGGYLKVNTTNIKIDPSATGTNSVFFAGDTSGNYIKYQGNGTLEVKGAITATSFTLSSGGSVSGLSTSNISGMSDYVTQNSLNTTLGSYALKSEIPNTFTVDGVSTVTWNGKTYVGLTQASDSFDGGVLVGTSGTNKHFVIPRSTTDTAVDICNSYIKFDKDANNYIHMDENGIDVQGNRININGKEVWARDDIVVLTPAQAASSSEITTIESNMATAQSNGTIDDWIMIVPSYNAKLNFTQREESGSYGWTPVSNHYITMAQNLEMNYFITPADTNNDYFDYTIQFSLIIPSSTTSNGQAGFICSLGCVGTDDTWINFKSGSKMTYTKSGGGVDQADNTDYPNNSSYTRLVTRYTGGSYTDPSHVVTYTLNITSPINVCKKDHLLQFWISQVLPASGNHLYIKSVTIEAKLKTANSRVPCAIYYYPAP